MPAKVLLVSVGLRDNDQIVAHRSIVSDDRVAEAVRPRLPTMVESIFHDDFAEVCVSQRPIRASVLH
jgi:hypothetical protein